MNRANLNRLRRLADRVPVPPLTEAERAFLRVVHETAVDLGADNHVAILTAAYALFYVDWAIRQAEPDAPADAPARFASDDELGEWLEHRWIPLLIDKVRAEGIPHALRHELSRYPKTPPAAGWPTLASPPRIVLPPAAPRPNRIWTPTLGHH